MCFIPLTAMPGQVEDRMGNAINEGDTVFTKIRGSKRVGNVSYISRIILTGF